MSSGYGDPNTRRRILEAAQTVAETMGPTMRIADIAKRANISRAAVYLHFEDRRGLVLALLAHMQESYAVHDLVVSLEEEDSLSERLRRMIEVLATLNGHIEQVGWLFDEAQHLDDAFGRDWRNRVKGTRDWIRGQLARNSIHLGEGWDVDSATDLVFAVTSLGSWRDLTRDLGWTQEQFIQSAHRWVSTIIA